MLPLQDLDKLLPPSPPGRERPPWDRPRPRFPVRASFLLLSAALLALLALASSAEGDPRITLVELQVDGRPDEALRRVDQLLAADPEAARRLGLDYLRGHLLLLQGRRQDALEAFATAMSTTPQLGPYSRYRLALEQESLGHPEVAAGLVATLLRSSPPSGLVRPAVELLRRTVLDGGDCRVLRGMERVPLRTRERRELDLAVAECHLREGDLGAAEEAWLQLLEADHGDPVARIASDRLVASLEARSAGREPQGRAVRAHLLVGLAYFQHREFDAAIQHLARALAEVPAGGGMSAKEVYDARYALARSHFWQGRYRAAAAAFHSLAAETGDPGRKVQALFQEARCHELLGEWAEATARFRAVRTLDPSGGWADSALIAELRLAWRQGDAEAARGALETLLARRYRTSAARALLFLASSDLVGGRADRSGPWLEQAATLRRLTPRELGYWQARQAEAQGRGEAAVAGYLEVLREDPQHPYGQAAHRRLAAASLAPALAEERRQLAARGGFEDLYRLWLLLPDGDPAREPTRRRLAAAVAAADGAAAVFLELAGEPIADWPLWRADLRDPEELLLALGLFPEAGAMVNRYFPLAKPDLAFAAGQALAGAGEARRSLYIAEVLAQRVPRDVPPALLPEGFRQLLHPFHYRQEIEREAARRGVDPHLLAALVREESRFDPRAFSSASARGLTQFVMPTARRVAEEAGLGAVAPEDVERPEVAIALGAAYLGRLSRDFEGSVPEMVAAYNAGEPQAALWRTYCFSGETEEYLAKVAFKETREYLAKVLTSRAHYAELYPLAPSRP